MRPTITLDTRAFNQVLKQAVEQSSRSAAEAINFRMFNVLLKAIRLTEKASRERIAWQLGQVGTKAARSTKTGKRLKKRIAALREDSFAARIVNARRRDYAGPEYMLWGHALDDAARKLIAARQRSVAFIKSGWLWGLKIIARAIPGGGRKGGADKDAKLYGQPKGTALPARFRLTKTFIATATNSALIAGGGKFQSPGAHNPLPVAEAGLRAAFVTEQAEMEKHLKDKLAQALRKVGVTVR